MKIKEYLRKEGGFTLVELLVVIVIIGILAVGVLAAINPIEQIRRGRDTARQSAAREILGAAERIYGMAGDYPSAGGWTKGTAFTVDAAAVQELIDAAELRSGFENRSPIDNGELEAYIDDSGTDEMRVCFQPESDAFSDRASCTSASDCSAGTDWYCVPDSAD